MSEVLLRKTRAEDADPVFAEFVRRYPTVASLAGADVGDVRTLVAPLGLPRRAETLIAISRKVVSEHRGRVPADSAALRRLPGIGPYAAGAVLALGHGKRAPMVDGPLGRFYRRFAGIPDTGRAAYYDKRAWRAAAALVPVRMTRPYYYALIDLVAAYCLPRTPRCLECPVRSQCAFGRRAA